MKEIKFIIMMVILLAVWSCEKSEENKKVFIVFSYHQEYAWVESLNEGIDESFEGQDVVVEKFYMDTKRKTSSEWKTTITDSAMQRIESYNPDLLIIIDDNACELIGKQFIGDDLPVVFTGMNKEPSSYGFPTTNITGCIERISYTGMIEFLKELIPDVDTNESLIPAEVMQWTTENNNLPEFCAFDFGIIDGALCGVFKSGSTQGAAAVAIALRILDGEDPVDIPVENPQQSSKIINRSRANYFGITIPENTDWIIVE